MSSLSENKETRFGNELKHRVTFIEASFNHLTGVYLPIVMIGLAAASGAGLGFCEISVLLRSVKSCQTALESEETDCYSLGILITTISANCFGFCYEKGGTLSN